MTTEYGEVLDATMARAERPTIQVARVRAPDAGEREARARRLILVGALASFLSFFGLTVALEQQSQPAPASAPVVTADGSTLSAPVVPDAPQIRTSTS